MGNPIVRPFLKEGTVVVAVSVDAGVVATVVIAVGGDVRGGVWL